MRNICLTLVAAGTLFLLSACSDPYEREIPASGFVAAGEAEDIVGRLNDSDKDLFRRWAKRAPTNERFPGEAIPRSVRSALTNQTRFEALQAEKSAKDAEKIAEEERVAKEKQKQVDEQRDAYQKMKETDSFIKEYFIANPVSYNLVPIFNSYGALSHREWQFNVRLTNRTPNEIIGVSGLVLVKNAFGEEIDWYDFRVEPKISPGKTIDYTFSMRHNPKDPAHMAMLNTETLFFEWLFDSLAFRDGTKLDYQSLIDSGDIQPNSVDAQKPATSI